MTWVEDDAEIRWSDHVALVIKGRSGQGWPHGHAAVRSWALGDQEDVLVLTLCLMRPQGQQNIEWMTMDTQTAKGRGGQGQPHPKGGVTEKIKGLLQMDRRPLANGALSEHQKRRTWTVPGLRAISPSHTQAKGGGCG